MIEKIATLWPEIIMLSGACLCMIVGLSPKAAARRATVWIAAAALTAAGWAVHSSYPIDGAVGLAPYVKLAVALVGLLLLMATAGVPDQLKMTRDSERSENTDKRFEPGDVMRGEFYAFFLFSLTGVMLCSEAGDLVWLFLALELTSLPTYVMVAVSRDRRAAQESAVKYFFLGAMAAAVFVYGFALIYGACGFTEFRAIADHIATHGVSPLMLAGLILSIIGLAFKIAAVPMHFYAADVYQGAHVAVTAFLAFVPKTAGFVAIILLLQLVPAQQTPMEIKTLLWIMAAATMTVGNVLGVLQHNVKRVLAYSSIAHSGYMLVPLAGGVGWRAANGDGAAAVMFYLVVYGLATLASFAVLGCLQRQGDEAQTYDDLAGLVKREPAMAGVMLLSLLSLIGLPPLAGFLGKFYLLSSAVAVAEADLAVMVLVVIAVVNSAIAAVYYLRIIAACFFSESREPIQRIAGVVRPLAAGLAVIAAIFIGVRGGWLVDAAKNAGVQPDGAAAKQSGAPHDDATRPVTANDTSDQPDN